MAFVHKDGRGRAFANKYWEGIDDNKPRWKGNAMVGGVVWNVAVWERGEDLSLSFEEPQERPERQEELPIKKPTVVKSLKELRPLKDELDDDIPF